MPTKRLVSAGGVVFSLRDGAIHVVVCGRTDTGTWTLPKGALAESEEIEEAAVREVAEETGLSAEIVSELGAIQFWFVGMPERVRYRKTVHYFLMVPLGGDMAQHDWEFDVVRWVPVDEACRLLSYENEREMMRQAEQAIVQLVEAGQKAEPEELNIEKWGRAHHE